MSIDAKKRRAHWVAELETLSGLFADDATKILGALQAEIAADGITALLDHLHVCGALPERYGHDSSAEKLYAKYTDAVISEALTAIGLRSTVISARSDTADVQARASNYAYSMVADAKAFRLSRTAKNQKDFKIQALDGWRNELDYAVVVCPIYQLPTRVSQIYQQAIVRNVCILSYTHLATLLMLGQKRSQKSAEFGLLKILKIVSTLHPTKSVADYWIAINNALLSALGKDSNIWTAQKKASLYGLHLAKDEALAYLCNERNRILSLSHQQALSELLRLAGIDSRITQVQRLQHGHLLGDLAHAPPA